MSTIKLEDATKAEIIQAIREEYVFGDVRRRIEIAIVHIRVRALLSQMDEACKEMQANHQTSGAFDFQKHERWLRASKRWNRINCQIDKFQGI